MTTREKIIVAVMCLTIIYGAYELLAPRIAKTPKSDDLANPTEELSGFVSEVSQKMADNSRGQAYSYLVDKAGVNWTKDPFLRSITPLRKTIALNTGPKQATTASATPRFVYTGYLELGKTKIAVINGMEYAVGESIDPTGYFLKNVSSERAIIGNVNGSEPIRLPLTEID